MGTRPECKEIVVQLDVQEIQCVARSCQCWGWIEGIAAAAWRCDAQVAERSSRSGENHKFSVSLSVHFFSLLGEEQLPSR